MKFFFLIVLFTTFLYSSQEEVLKSANSLKLYEKNEWKALLHYSNKINIIDKAFILSENFSLKNELDSTISAFYTPKENYKNINNHAQCKFPARLLFISHELSLSDDEFPKVECKDFNIYKMQSPADKIDVVYATPNVKRTTSMMGHTFLKYSGENYQGKEVEHSITFYTVVDSSNLLKLAYQNLFPGMKGLFVLQEYEKVFREYIDMKNRNIWEYQLSLSKYRRELIYSHMWELKGMDMKYFFTSYNCSTVIYYALSLANPKIYDDYKLWVTPLDTVKFLYKYNLIEDTELFLSNEWLIKTTLEPLKISKYKSPNKIPNERQVALGYSNINKEEFLKLSFLPASHLLSDNNQEYFGESELKITYLSLLVNKENIELDEFTLYGMKSYTPYDSLTNDLLYQFELAIKKEYSEDVNYVDTLKIDGGIGIDFLLSNEINVFAIFNLGVGYNIDDSAHIFFNPQVGGMIYEIFDMKSLLYYQPLFINQSKVYDKYVLNHNLFFLKDFKLYFNFEQVNANMKYENYEFGLSKLF